MAHELEISQTKYSKFENGKAELEIETVGKLLDLLEISIAEAFVLSDKQVAYLQQNNMSQISTLIDIKEIRKIVKEEIQNLI